jgi:hypothetical protein
MTYMCRPLEACLLPTIIKSTNGLTHSSVSLILYEERWPSLMASIMSSVVVEINGLQASSNTVQQRPVKTNLNAHASK